MNDKFVKQLFNKAFNDLHLKSMPLQSMINDQAANKKQSVIDANLNAVRGDEKISLNII